MKFHFWNNYKKGEWRQKMNYVHSLWPASSQSGGHNVTAKQLNLNPDTMPQQLNNIPYTLNGNLENKILMNMHNHKPRGK